MLVALGVGWECLKVPSVQKPPPPAMFSPSKVALGPFSVPGWAQRIQRQTECCLSSRTRQKGEAALKHSKDAHKWNCDSRHPGGGAEWEGVWGWGRLLPCLRYPQGLVGGVREGSEALWWPSAYRWGTAVSGGGTCPRLPG